MNERMPEKIVRVREVMKTSYDLVPGTITVREALEQMKHVETKCLIVDKFHPEDEYGIVVIADIARHVLAKHRSPDRVSLYEVMSKPALCVHPEMDIRHAANLFARFELSRAPVVDAAGNVVGIVSMTDMVLKGLMRLL